MPITFKMRRSLLFLILLISGFRLSAQQNGNSISGKTTANHIYAVVVGISQYAANDNIPSLKYAHRDAQEFAQYLQSPSGGSVPTENIRLLVNEQATVAAVYDALSWLTQTCGKDDLVFFYFAGHGDLESQTIFNLGFLLAYNTPRPNYINNALRIEDLNNIANTLSVTNNAKVVLITDACHSGDLAGKGFRGSFLIGDALRKTKNDEVRITSCLPNQLSSEDAGWGGGRGVFSWYLVNGLKGLADTRKEGVVRVQDIQLFLDSSLSRDPILEENNTKQTPVITGDGGFTLATVDKTTLANIKIQMVAPKVNQGQLKPLPIQPEDKFFRYLKEHPLEEMVNFFRLDSVKTEDIPIAFIDQLLARQTDDEFIQNAKQLKSSLLVEKDKLNRFTQHLIECIHNRGQEIINLYLKGDAAELEKRRYYNINSSGYDMFPHMFSTAVKLTSSSNYLYRILQIDQHYFAGVAARLKVPTVDDPRPLLAISLSEQLKAFKLEGNAAFIHNELGALYMLKGELAKAEPYLIRATQIAPEWAIPWTNLCTLYSIQKKFQAGIQAGRTADSLQAGLHGTQVSMGLLYENAGNRLLAEEYQRKAIDINSRHYLPFERLGYVYTSTTQYAAADSFFYEADLRKKGFHFKSNPYIFVSPAYVLPVSPTLPCKLDTSLLDKKDVMAFFYWGMQEYTEKNYGQAERIFKKIIAVERNNPLVYHYLGKLFYDQQQWERAEIMFKLAIWNHLEDSVFNAYCDSMQKVSHFTYEHECFEAYFRSHHYTKDEDHYFIASIYEHWGHYAEAEYHYRWLMKWEPGFIGSYFKLWNLMEKLGRYEESEKIIQQFGAYNPKRTTVELNDFYKRAISKFPGSSQWPHKLGLLLYDLAQIQPGITFLDTIVYFPLMNKEIFIDLVNYSDLHSPSMWLPPTKNIGEYTSLSELIIKHETFPIPGTKEWITLGISPIYTPRKDAITYLSMAAGLITDSLTLADINYKIGNLYIWAGSKKQAHPFYAASVNLSPLNAGFRLTLIDISKSLYKNSLALENLEYLYKNRQINFPDRLLLAEFDIHAGTFNEAKDLLDTARAIYPYTVPAISDLNGRLQLLSGQPRQALPWYTDYLSLTPGDSITMYTIARLYAEMGNTESAWKWLEKSMNNGFNYSFVLAYDPAWEKYRGTAKWNTVSARFPKMKRYANPDIHP